MAHALAQLGGKLEILDRGADGQPLRQAKDPIAGTILRAHFDLPTAEAGGDSGERLDATLAGVTLLVVEDSPSSRDWLVATLQKTGASVQAVGSGVKALEILRDPAAGRIDLLLTDMTLPQMSGVALVRQIRRDQAAGTMVWEGPMLGLTAHSEDRLRKACLAMGMLKVLEKPIRHSALCRAIREALPQVSTITPPDPVVGASKTEPEFSPINEDVVAELIDHMSLPGAKGFMQKALSEAQVALDDIRRAGLRDDTKRMLHAATGACGLTGLALLEKRLRALELAVDHPGSGFGDECAALEAAIAATSTAINQLA